jgi:serine/threonine-protein kinase
VALKVLPPELTCKEAGLKRFEREARLASALDHPNICTIFDLYAVEGIHFIAMQHVEGRNVRQLVNGKPLELRVALSIAIQLADALAAAHARGIIHRDIKPGNVMVTDTGQVKVLDFGLAKLSDEVAAQAQGIHHTQLTEIGVPYGTATSAAPEQATGGKVDYRADIFSMGVVLYEMLAGTWPFQGKTTIEVRYAVLHGAPKPLAEARGESSPAVARLQEILDRALAKDPNDRYQQIGEMRDDLRAVLRDVDPDASQDLHNSSVPPARPFGQDLLVHLSRHRLLLVGVAAVLLFAAAFGLYKYFVRARTPEINSLAVLPFANVSADPDAEYLSDGITESLINSLSQLPTVKVRSRNSVFRYKGDSANPTDVARKLNVMAVLTGNVERRGDDLSINVELINAGDDSHVWGERYARKISDLPKLQEEISRDVTDKLRLQLTGEQQRQLVKGYDTNSEAYQLYLQGRYQWNRRTPDSLQEGIKYFTRAIEKDPKYAPAYSGLADSYWLLNVYNVGPATEFGLRAREAASRALALDDSLAEAHASLGSISYRYDWNWAEAEQHFKRAIQFKADYPSAHQWYAAMLAAQGRFDESNAEGRRAHELEPFSLTINSDVGRHLYYARQYEPALGVHHTSLAMDQNFARGHLELGYVLSQTGRADQAIAEFQRALSIDKESVSALSGLGYTYAVTGRRNEAAKIIEQLKEQAGRRYVSPYQFAVIYSGLGDRRQALDFLEKAADERFNWIVFLSVEPQFETLRSEPRFAALLNRIHLSR